MKGLKDLYYYLKCYLLMSDHSNSPGGSRDYFCYLSPAPNFKCKGLGI